MLTLTPEIIEAAYEFLRAMPPFNKWGLPHADEVGFRISLRAKEYGRYQWDGENHTITVSAKAIGYTITLLEFVAHEMIHLDLEEKGLESRNGGEDTHNAEFRKRAAQVCKIHGFDPKAFY